MAETLPVQTLTRAACPDVALWPPSWRHARRAVMLALLLPGLILAMIVLDGWLRVGHPERAAADWMGRLGLSTPACWPAGDPMHYPPEVSP